MNILFTCAGRRTYLLKYFKENMQSGDKVVATDMQLTAPALQVADVKIQVPAVYDPKYIEITLGICQEQNIDALISLNDLELPILAENKAKFDELGVTVIVSDPNVIDICFDKYKTAQWVESLGLNAPKTYVTLASAKEALSKGKKSLRSVDKILLSWAERDDIEKEGHTSLNDDWDKNLEETIRIAKTPWLDQFDDDDKK